MFYLHSVGEKLRKKNRKPKFRALEKIGDYDLFKEEGLFLVKNGARAVGYRPTQQAAHKLIKADVRRQAELAKREKAAA